MKYVVSTKAELLTALKSAKAGETVFVKGTAVIDMTGTPSVTIPAGVTLASDRGRAGSAGALLKRTKNLNGGWEEPMLIVGGDNVRVTGLRLQGEQYPQDYGNDEVYPGSINERYYLVGIYAENRKGFEVDNCEMYGWAWSAYRYARTVLRPSPTSTTITSTTTRPAVKATVSTCMAEMPSLKPTSLTTTVMPSPVPV